MMKSIRVMYVATNEYYYALRSMDSEHLRAAFRAGVPRQLKAHNFYILTETVKRRINPLVGVRVEDIQISGDALAVQLQLTTATPSRIYIYNTPGRISIYPLSQWVKRYLATYSTHLLNRYMLRRKTI